ncbi:uncharacterized protein LOC143596436 [Bidens hawaiensis]|uniref:uncharacterized protein LOC143596436 n=1 Tax=Bidens hawaiensis TaxID=980011 RepID=UPI004049109F
MKSFYKPVSGPSLVDLDNLPWDPADRKRILDHHPDQRDEIWRKYWINGPCQPRGHKFPKRKMGSKEQHFGGRNVFSKEGFNSWNKSERLSSHEGGVGSAHNKALKRCEDLLNQKQSIVTIFHKQDDIMKRANRLRLNATIDDCRLCLKNVLSFRGHDESKTSLCKGNFLEIWELIYKHNEELRKLPKAAGNNQYLSPSIQKDVANCFEEEILNSIFKDIGDDMFDLLVDESSDVSKKEQMAIVLRYVDKRGLVKESFVGLVHVMETSSSALKSAIDTYFAKYGLSFKILRGQGYDGANNTRGQFNGLKAKILEENESAYYVHCFAHQL